MCLEIREMRAVDYPPLAALWEGSEEAAPVEDQTALEGLLRRNRALCVVACQEAKVLCAVLCERDSAGGCTGTLVTDPTSPDDALAAVVLGKCLGKMASQGVHRFRVVERPARERDSFWSSVRWIDADTAPSQLPGPGSETDAADGTTRAPLKPTGPLAKSPG